MQKRVRIFAPLPASSWKKTFLVLPVLSQRLGETKDRYVESTSILSTPLPTQSYQPKDCLFNGAVSHNQGTTRKFEESC